MALEVIERLPEHDVSGPPIVFVHGFWQAAWCWDEHVLPALAERGHHAVAVSLRGHGGSEGKIRGRSIRHNVADVLAVVEGLEQVPVIVGHSMGGFILQHYLARGHPAAGAALIAPVPASGAWRATLRAIRAHPGAFLKSNLILDVGAMVEKPHLAHDLLFGPQVSREEADRYFDRWERASYRTYLDLLFNAPHVPVSELEMTVIGGTEDAFFAVEEWERTAERWRARLVVIEGAGHQIMLEPAWERIVDEIELLLETVSLRA